MERQVAMAIESVDERRVRLDKIQERENRIREQQQKEMDKLEAKKDLRAEEYQKMQERKSNIDIMA